MSSLFDKAKDAAEKAEEVAAEHSGTVDSGIDKVGGLLDKATKGRFSDQLDAVEHKAHDAVDHLDQPADGPAAPTDPGH